MTTAERTLKTKIADCDVFQPKDYYASMKRCVKYLKVYYEYHNKAKLDYINLFEELKRTYPYMFDKRSGLPKKAYEKFIDERLPKLYFLQPSDFR